MALQELGAPRVLIKGGHHDDGAEAVDLLLDLDGEACCAPRGSTP
jgi:hydroxymethylpyrimidine/phosphomethylpyrimidine kinase